jgi:aryl-alcohol dehydrogenase-like predicted oxidoreductase
MPVPHNRRLGANGPEVGPLALGAMALTGVYGVVDEHSAIATVHRALALGVTMVDTSPSYSDTRNESFVGRALRGRRDEVLLATKWGAIWDADGKPATDGRPAWARESLEGSLRRLGTDHVDLLYLHRVDPAVPVEESVGAMAELVADGLVRYIGLSEVGPKTVRRAHAIHPLTAVQSEYSLWTREPERLILSTLAELGIGLVAFSPLGRGFLTGQIRRFEDLPPGDWRRTAPRFQPGNFERNLQLVGRVEQLAQARGATAAQFALAWILHRLPHGVPLFGATTAEMVESNLRASELALTDAELDALDALGEAQGERWPEAFLEALNVE